MWWQADSRQAQALHRRRSRPGAVPGRPPQAARPRDPDRPPAGQAGCGRSSPMRWSVTRSSGKLYVRIFSLRSPEPTCDRRSSPRSAAWRSLLLLEQAGAQDGERLGAVLVLALLVLDGDDQAGRQVGDPHRRVGGVDALAAGAARPIHVDPQVLLVDLRPRPRPPRAGPIPSPSRCGSDRTPRSPGLAGRGARRTRTSGASTLRRRAPRR